MKKMFLYYDKEGDYLEVRMGAPKVSDYEDIGNDIFVKRDKKTGEPVGYKIFNLKKRKEIGLEVPTL